MIKAARALIIYYCEQEVIATSMYYQFDSRLNMPAILFDDDRIVVAGKEYDYTELNDIEITKAPFIATYGIMELRMDGRTVPVPFAKGDLHRLRTAVQETKHIISTLKKVKEAEMAGQDGRGAVQESAPGSAGAVSDSQSGGQPEAAVRTNAAAGQEPVVANMVKMDPYEEMKKLKELLDLDIITQEEFARKKKELLGL